MMIDAGIHSIDELRDTASAYLDHYVENFEDMERFLSIRRPMKGLPFDQVVEAFSEEIIEHLLDAIQEPLIAASTSMAKKAVPFLKCREV